MIFRKAVQKYKNLPVVARATGWFVICSLIQKGISFLTTPIFTRLMSTEQYGLFSVYTSWLQILTIFSTFRLDYSVFNKGMSKYPEDRDGYASSMLGLTTVINTALLVLYFIFRKPVNAFTELNTFLFLCMFLQLYFIPAINFWSLRQRYEFRYRMVVFVTVIMAVCNAGLGVAAVLLFENKGMARIASGVIVEVIIGLIIYAVSMWKGKSFWNFEHVRFAILFNIPLIPHYFATYIVEQSDRIMIQKLIDFGAAALYSIAYTVGGIVKIFISALTNTLIPLQYRLLEEKAYRELNRQITTVMLGVSGMIAGLSAVAPEIVLVLGGEKYRTAVYVMPPVIASVYFSFLYTLLANIEFFFDENRFAMKISLLGAAVNVLLNFLFIPKFGYVAAAYTTLVCYMIYAVGHFWFVSGIASRKAGERILNPVKLLGLGMAVTVLSIAMSLLYPYVICRYILVGAAVLTGAVQYKRVLAFLKRMRG